MAEKSALDFLLILLGGGFSFAFGEAAARWRMRERRTERLLFESLARRQGAYEQLFKASRRLEAYLRPFAALSEFDEQHDRETFAPLEEMNLFRREFEDVALWLDQRTSESAEDLVSSLERGAGIALHLAAANMNVESALARAVAFPGDAGHLAGVEVAQHHRSSMVDAVPRAARSALEKAEKLHGVLREALGLTALDATSDLLRRGLARQPRNLPSRAS